MTSASRRREIALVVFYLGLGVASGLLWARVMSWAPLAPGQIPRIYTWHHEMVTGTAMAPNQYRVLTPRLADLLAPLMPNGDVFTAYFVIRSLAVFFSLVFFDRYLRKWFSPSAAAAGAICLAAVIPFTYYRVVQESDPINLMVIVMAFWAIVHERDIWLLPLLLLGTLNRETTLMIPAVYFLARWGFEQRNKTLVRTLLLTGLWTVVFFGLRLVYGHHPAYTDLAEVRRENFGSWLPTIFMLAFLGALWVLPFFARKEAPPILRRTIWLMPPFVALHYCVGVVQEVRLFLPLTPILIPLSWYVLFPEAKLGTAPVEAAPVKAKVRR